MLLPLAGKLLSNPARLRQLSSTTHRCSKASKARALKPRVVKTDALRGTGVGASQSVYGADEAVVGRAELPVPERAEVRPKSVPAAASGGIGEVEDESYSVPVGKEALRGTGVGASEAVYPAADAVVGRAEPEPNATPIEPPTAGSSSSSSDSYGPETDFYTSVPPYNVPLVLTASFVITLFCVVGADTARVGWTELDEETGEYRLAPAWQRWTYALGMGGVGVGAALCSSTPLWLFARADPSAEGGALAPSRVITKMTIARPLSAATRFPPSSRVTLHTPVSKLPFYPRRTIPLSSIHLLGPLSTSPKPWHPKAYVAPAKPPRTGVFADAWRKVKATLVAEPKPRKERPKSAVLSHVPILVEGDRFSYSLQKTRGEKGGDKGAWCEDWEGLEKSLLGVRE